MINFIIRITHIYRDHGRRRKAAEYILQRTVGSIQRVRRIMIIVMLVVYEVSSNVIQGGKHALIVLFLTQVNGIPDPVDLDKNDTDQRQSDENHDPWKQLFHSHKVSPLIFTIGGF